MKKLKKMLYIILIIVVVISVGSCAVLQQPQFGKKPSGERLERIKKSPNYKNGAFQNIDLVEEKVSFSDFFSIFYKNFIQKHPDKTPTQKIPAVKTDLNSLKDNELVWLGHSSYFLKINGKNILIDPVFHSASPFQFMVKPFDAEYNYSAFDLPEIDLLIITHDHYDHLDYELMKEIRPKVKHILTSLGVGSHLEHWGFDNQQLTELDWWEETSLYQMKFTSLPTQHFSGRSLKRNQTLWGAFMLEINNLTLYIGGDSGYGSHLGLIAQKFPKIDFALLENGQYNEDWAKIHFMPNDLVKAIKELNPTRFFTGHHSKFALARHPWYEPLEKISQASKTEHLSLVTSKIGEVLSVVPKE